MHSAKQREKKTVKTLLKWMKIPFILVAVLVLGVVGWSFLSGKSILQTVFYEKDSKIIKSIEREEQVVLLSLGVQGILEGAKDSTIFGINVPGSARTSFLQYEYKAKLGIEGKEVKVNKTGEREYTVTIPGYLFIGHSDAKFKTAVDSNGVLSFVTPEIDKAATISKILSKDAQQKLVEENLETLNEQAKHFYGGILKSVDPEIDVKFVFTGAAGVAK